MNERTRRISNTAVLHACTILSSASLLFLVQPMIARMLLPRLGGTAAVWTTCMLFFQLLLLGGYLYAHLLSTRLSPRMQRIVHGALVIASLCFLPIAIRDGAPSTETIPIAWLFVTLSGAVGLPFFVLSSTSPLLQSWFARSGDPLAHDPYPLYAASNVGSLSSLLAYPFLVEPLLPLRGQSLAWTGSFVVFALLLTFCAARGPRRHAADGASTSTPATGPLPRGVVAHWIMLAAIPSSLLLGVTTHITTDVAPLPLLWIVPLALYLLTFIVVFAQWSERAQRRTVLLAWVGLPATLVLLIASGAHGLPALALHLLVYFALALAFHGKLALEKPEAAHLTSYFLCLSIGGAVGGLFNGLVAPLLLDRFLELHVVLFVASFYLLRPVAAWLEQGPRARWLLTAAMAAGLSVAGGLALDTTLADTELMLTIVLVSLLLARLLALSVRRTWYVACASMVALQLFVWSTHDVLATHRSFYSAHTVVHDAGEQTTRLMHGTTLHGLESSAQALRGEPLGYYHRQGPVGQVLASLEPDVARRYAFLGLGAGALAAYCGGHVRCDFFEIDAAVHTIAREHFSYLARCAEACSVEIGDGRALLETKPAGTYDAIFLDAYNSDSVPIHLITLEAVSLYRQKTKPAGLLFFHVSNRHLDLLAPLAPMAETLGLAALHQVFRPDEEQKSRRAQASRWVVMSDDPQTLERHCSDPRWRALTPRASDPRWTDDFSNLLRVIAPAEADFDRGE